MDSHLRRRWKFRDVLIVGALALLLAPGLIVLVRSRREASARVTCAANLKALGLALLLYSNENRGSVPRVRYAVAKVVTPVWGTGATSSDPFTGPEPHDVTAAMFLLLRTQDITAEAFICPSTDAVPDTCGGAGVGRKETSQGRATFTDWRKNLSYSMQNPYLDDWGKSRFVHGSISAEFAVAADMNPGTVGADDDVTKPTINSPAIVMKIANSNNHGGDGQNVLYGDGHVEFRNSPFAGVGVAPFNGISRDNIFTNELGLVVASARREWEDSILLPTDD
jgi:prepilin-type processing-associated H-X9-DG protein